MKSAVKAALKVFGLDELPKTQDELKAVYRCYVKRTHPDICGGHAGTKPFHRGYRAKEVLSEAIDEAGQPCVLVKFGGGNPKRAKVARNVFEKYEPAQGCEFIVALKWFTGLSIQVASGEWCDVPEPVSFCLGGVWVVFV